MREKGEQKRKIVKNCEMKIKAAFKNGIKNKNRKN